MPDAAAISSMDVPANPRSAQADAAPASKVRQWRLLLQRGVREPIMAALTRIGTVEGFGGAMRMWSLDEPQRYFADPIDGTTLAHLPGMFEAQARDEAGWADEFGH